MLEENQPQIFLCSSADWNQVVENANSFEEAAAFALQMQIDSDSDKFSVGAVISVSPIKINKEATRLIYAPSVLADIGMHNHAAEMIKQIDQDDSKN